MSSKKLHCKLTAISDVEHLHQVYAGFAMLHRAGEIELEQEVMDVAGGRSAGRWDDYKFFNTTVVINGAITLTYDTHDRAWIDPEILSSSDLYFKRSFRRNEIADLPGNEKIHPLGLNMQVNDPCRDLFRLRRAALYSGKDRIKMILKSLRLDNVPGQGEVERLDNFEALPQPTREPRVLYLARLWDPAKIESKVQSEAVAAMNESRVASVIRLRKELGGLFLGGVSHDDYSRKYFPEGLIDDPSLSQKRAYLRKMKEFPICVATVGLNGSNGWKLAEYVAASKAIITEPLVYEVPGDFEAERNYLEFRSRDQLADAAHRLIGDHALRQNLMENNRDYYLRYGRPDAIVRNTLTIVSELLRSKTLI